jgi:hypothetical protein
MVADSCNFVYYYYRAINHRFLLFTTACIHISSSLGDMITIKKKFEKLKEISFKTLNFFILLPVYFLGVGISHLLWKFFESGKKASEVSWIKSKKLKKEIESYEESY